MIRRMWNGVVGLIQWAVTFVNKKGDISHSKQGMLLFEADDMFAELDEAGKEFVKDFITTHYGWDCDEYYAYRVWMMDCADEEE